MFKKLKASLGIGSAKVDTILDEMSVFQGATLKGRFISKVETSNNKLMLLRLN